MSRSFADIAEYIEQELVGHCRSLVMLTLPGSGLGVRPSLAVDEDLLIDGRQLVRAGSIIIFGENDEPMVVPREEAAGWIRCDRSGLPVANGVACADREAFRRISGRDWREVYEEYQVRLQAAVEDASLARTVYRWDFHHLCAELRQRMQEHEPVVPMLEEYLQKLDALSAHEAIQVLPEIRDALAQMRITLGNFLAEGATRQGLLELSRRNHAYVRMNDREPGDGDMRTVERYILFENARALLQREGLEDLQEFCGAVLHNQPREYAGKARALRESLRADSPPTSRVQGEGGRSTRVEVCNLGDARQGPYCLITCAGGVKLHMPVESVRVLSELCERLRSGYEPGLTEGVRVLALDGNRRSVPVESISLVPDLDVSNGDPVILFHLEGGKHLEARASQLARFFSGPVRESIENAVTDGAALPREGRSLYARMLEFRTRLQAEVTASVSRVREMFSYKRFAEHFSQCVLESIRKKSEESEGVAAVLRKIGLLEDRMGKRPELAVYTGYLRDADGSLHPEEALQRLRILAKMPGFSGSCFHPDEALQRLRRAGEELDEYFLDKLWDLDSRVAQALFNRVLMQRNALMQMEHMVAEANRYDIAGLDLSDSIQERLEHMSYCHERIEELSGQIRVNDVFDGVESAALEDVAAVCADCREHLREVFPDPQDRAWVRELARDFYALERNVREQLELREERDMPRMSIM